MYGEDREEMFSWLRSYRYERADLPTLPRPLFATAIDGYKAPNRYAVSSDGRRFLMNVPAPPPVAARVTVVRNWQRAVE